MTEILEELENPDIPEIPDEIVILPPDNANDPNTDEDSGEEDDIVVNNLPGAQLRAEAHVVFEDEWDSDDEKPLSELVERIPKKIKKFNYSQSDLQPNVSSWIPIQNVSNNLSPATIFKLFFDDQIIGQIVNFSNIYAQQRNRLGNITTDEMYCFIGILILSGYCSVSRKNMYWQNSDDTNNKLICAAMSRDRFQFVLSNIHCNNNNNLNSKDKFAKMRPLFDSLNKKNLEYAPVEENHSIDEAMVPYFGRHGCKQFIRGKPIRWGYKFWVGATKLGYVVYFDPYQGFTTTLPERYKHLGLGASVVLQYVDVLQTLPYGPFHLFFDNYFTSLSLLKELTFRKINGTGTMRENRIPLSPLNSSKYLKKKERGLFEYTLADNEIILCKWNDNSVVTIASNASCVFPLNRAKRFSQSEKKYVYIDQPNLIKMYNENMGGVDRSDQNIGQYRISIRGKKWYFPILSYCIDMAVQNSWHLHKNNGGKMDQLSFRRAIVTELLETHKSATKRGPSKSSKNLHKYSRFDEVNHLIKYQDNQRRCAVCHKKANFLCQKCDVTLHPRHCFLNYHTV